MYVITSVAKTCTFSFLACLVYLTVCTLHWISQPDSKRTCTTCPIPFGLTRSPGGPNGKTFLAAHLELYPWMDIQGNREDNVAPKAPSTAPKAPRSRQDGVY